MADTNFPTQADTVNTYLAKCAEAMARATAAADWRQLVADCAARGDE